MPCSGLNVVLADICDAALCTPIEANPASMAATMAPFEIADMLQLLMLQRESRPAGWVLGEAPADAKQERKRRTPRAKYGLLHCSNASQTARQLSRVGRLFPPCRVVRGTRQAPSATSFRARASAASSGAASLSTDAASTSATSATATFARPRFAQRHPAPLQSAPMPLRRAGAREASASRRQRQPALAISASICSPRIRLRHESAAHGCQSREPFRDHAGDRRRARPEAGRIPAAAEDPRPRADAHRARHLLGHVVGALLLQILARLAAARCRPPARR